MQLVASNGCKMLQLISVYHFKYVSILHLQRRTLGDFMTQLVRCYGGLKVWHSRGHSTIFGNPYSGVLWLVSFPRMVVWPSWNIVKYWHTIIFYNLYNHVQSTFWPGVELRVITSTSIKLDKTSPWLIYKSWNRHCGFSLGGWLNWRRESTTLDLTAWTPGPWTFQETIGPQLSRTEVPIPFLEMNHSLVCKK